MDAQREKVALRDAIRERLAHLSPAERAAESRSLCRRLLELLPRKPLVLCGYVSLRDEVDIRPFLLAFLEGDGVLFLPRFERGALAFRRAPSLEGLAIGPFGIPEPPPLADALDPSALPYALIPARAYARDGRRLGRGNGGYDIWMRRQRVANPKTLFWGICFEAQLSEEIPMEEHDERVDSVITARGMLNT